MEMVIRQSKFSEDRRQWARQRCIALRRRLQTVDVEIRETLKSIRGTEDGTEIRILQNTNTKQEDRGRRREEGGIPQGYAGARHPKYGKHP